MFRPLRLAELDDSLELLRRHHCGKRLLEIGAGTGWQSRALSEAGFEVEAVDLPADSAISNHARAREWPIRDYDGVHLPFSDQQFDIVYSSNVLEHVVELDQLMDEVRRVLRPDGIALHLVPNGNWRLLSLLTFYPALAFDGASWLKRDKSAGPSTAASSRQKRSFARKLLRRMIPHAHGSVGTALGELRRFSRQSWNAYFERRGWEVVHYGNNGIIASGDYLLDSAFPLSLRRQLGRTIGGIAHVYLLRPQSR
jgi:SAM-dependent methyltransferase